MFKSLRRHIHQLTKATSSNPTLFRKKLNKSKPLPDISYNLDERRSLLRPDFSSTTITAARRVCTPRWISSHLKWMKEGFITWRPVRPTGRRNRPGSIRPIHPPIFSPIISPEPSGSPMAIPSSVPGLTAPFSR